MSKDQATKPAFEKISTQFRHVFLIDTADNGQLREVAVVKEEDNGTVYYIDIATLDNFDKGRLKSIVTSQHADKYPLWDLMSQVKLSNGKNALDYFHQLVKIKAAPGTVNTALGGGLATVAAQRNDLVGTGFTDPSSGVISN
jgi:hypothetical protein